MGLPLPRNSVEIPLYCYLRYAWWPPIQFVLARPWRDADENLGSLDARLTEASSKALAAAKIPSRVKLVIEQDARPGPKRASGSAQFVPQFGVEVPTRAHALLRVWRDRAIEQRQLGVQQLVNRASAWWLEIARLQPVIDQQKRRDAALAESPSHRRVAAYIAEPERARVNAVVAARGTAALCGGGQASQLLARAFARYAAHDPTLSDVRLPVTDDHVYDPAVQALAAAFCTAGLPGLTRRRTRISKHRRVTRPPSDPPPDHAPFRRRKPDLEF